MKATQIVNECTSNGVLDMDKVKSKAGNNKQLIEEIIEIAERKGISPESKGRKRQMING